MKPNSNSVTKSRSLFSRPLVKWGLVLGCLSAILAATYNEAGDVGKAREYMTANVDVCDVHADLVDVADDMLKKGHRRRPVLDHGRLVGQITCRQLLRVISEFNQNRIAAH